MMNQSPISKSMAVLSLVALIAIFAGTPAHAQEAETPNAGALRLTEPGELHPSLNDRPSYYDQAGTHYPDDHRRPYAYINWESTGAALASAYRANTATPSALVGELGVMMRLFSYVRNAREMSGSDEVSNRFADMRVDAALVGGGDEERGTVIGFRLGQHAIGAALVNPDAIGPCSGYFGASVEHLIQAQVNSADIRQNEATLGAGPAVGIICSDPNNGNHTYLVLGTTSRLTGALRGDQAEGGIEGAASVDLEVNLHVIAEDVALRSDLTRSYWTDGARVWRWHNTLDWTIGASHDRVERRHSTYYLVGLEGALGTFEERDGHATRLIEARGYAAVHFR